MILQITQKNTYDCTKNAPVTELPATALKIGVHCRCFFREKSSRGCSVKGHSKRLWKIHRKMPVQKSPFWQSYNLVKKETSAQVYSCEFWKYFKSIFIENTSGQSLLTHSTEHQWTVVSVMPVMHVSIAMCRKNLVSIELIFRRGIHHKYYL